MNRPILLLPLIAGLMSGPMPVLAQASGESCSLIEEEAQRLICYDLVFRAQPTVPTTAALPAPDAAQEELDPEIAELWPVTSVPTPVGNGLLVSVSTSSPEPITGSDQFAKMTISCGNNVTSLRFIFPGYFMTNDGRSNILQASIDGGEAESIETNAVDSVLNLGGTEKSLPMIQKLMAADRLTLTAAPSSGTSIEAGFDLKGAAQAIRPVREACNW